MSDSKDWQFSRDPKVFRFKNGMPEFMPKDEALRRINATPAPNREAELKDKENRMNEQESVARHDDQRGNNYPCPLHPLQSAHVRILELQSMDTKDAQENARLTLLIAAKDEALKEIANGSCCGEFVNGCPVNNFGGDNTAS